MITKAMILAHAASAGLVCTTAVTVTHVADKKHERAAVRRIVALTHQSVERRIKRIKKTALVCPPSGIVTIGTLQNYTRPLVPIDTVSGTGVLQASRQEGYGYGTVYGGGGDYGVGAGGGISNNGPNGGAYVPPKSPAVQPTPTPSALPEPGAWAMMLAGFGMVGLAARVKTRRVGTASNVGE